MLSSFRDRYRAQFYQQGRRDRLIPSTIERQLARKRDMQAAAQKECDLHNPTGNYYKRLSGTFQEGPACELIFMAFNVPMA